LLTNESGIIIDCNTSLTQLLGFTPADLVGFNCSKLIAGSGQSRHDKHIQTFIANTSLDAPAAKSDSSRRILGKQRSMLVQTKGSKSRLVRMVLYEFIDRDARRFLSTFVPDSTPTLTNFITCTAAASVHATISGTIVAANHAMMSLLGFDVGELIGASVSVLMPLKMRDVHERYLTRYAAGSSSNNAMGRPRRVIGQHKCGKPIGLLLFLGEYLDSQNQRLLTASMIADLHADTQRLFRNERAVQQVINAAGEDDDDDDDYSAATDNDDDDNDDDDDDAGEEDLITLDTESTDSEIAAIVQQPLLTTADRRATARAASTGAIDTKPLKLATVAANHGSSFTTNTTATGVVALGAGGGGASGVTFGAPGISGGGGGGHTFANANANANTRCKFNADDWIRWQNSARNHPDAIIRAMSTSSTSSALSDLQSATDWPESPREILQHLQHLQQQQEQHKQQQQQVWQQQQLAESGKRMMQRIQEQLIQLQRDALQRQTKLRAKIIKVQQQQHELSNTLPPLSRTSSLNTLPTMRSSVDGTGSDIVNITKSVGSNDTIRFTLDLNSAIVQERISAGGSDAVVYVCSIDGWRCALKELNVSRCNDATIEAFETEIRIVESLPYHPNICRYLGHDRRGDTIRLFMTRYSSTLASYIERQCAASHAIAATTDSIAAAIASQTPQKVAEWMRDLVAGLQLLHSRHIMHRDLKSDNIFIIFNERNDIQSLAIGDFDQARFGNGVTTVGTPGYIAPEVLLASETGHYTTAADIYSLGMIMFEIITHTRPYCNIPLFQISVQVLAGKRPQFPLSILQDKRWHNSVRLFHAMTDSAPDSRPSLEQIDRELEVIRRAC
jgi:PAS domain S-box-containing protein